MQIINPWWFYLIDIIDSLLVFSVVMACIFGVGVIILFVAFLCNKDSMMTDIKLGRGKDAEYSKGWVDTAKSILKWLVPLFVVSSFLSVVLPTSSTMYKMMAAQIITYERLDKAMVAGKLAKDELKKDIFDIINSFKDEKNLESKSKEKTN